MSAYGRFKIDHTAKCSFGHLNLSLFFLYLEPHDMLQQGPFGHGAEEGFQTGQGFPRRTRHRRHPKAKEKSKRLETISSPPDKDPVMLLNEYGQKRDELVCR